MQRFTLATIGVLSIVGLGLTVSSAQADSDKRDRATSSFGRGLNTAQPGNSVNHVIIPDKIKINEDGVVNFLVSGFHQIFVYPAGTQLSDINVPLTGTFINDLIPLPFYQGLAPAGGPAATPVTTDPSNARNRVESVSFPATGTYLVICNVRTHFNDGMFAFVKVTNDDDD